ncbi:Catechol 2,3-dioxygenase [Lentzea fradiae]|uniref:Catechol 2,3-dioxygenase n=1 Tax=Lentzea fradiae TaxID=200378 RepID=A0A1G7LB16_9PSEU|nr:VOC family protein [Lentzea fradiae]SDF46717.1 Catechol 2,3-dioxygenase [Lentzea fradiae]
MSATPLPHLARGVDHAAFPTLDPAATIRFYRDVLGFPVVHSICAAGWGPEKHPDFVHFFFDIGNNDRIAFFHYFGFEPPMVSERGDAFARFNDEMPGFYITSRHLAIHVESEEHLTEYQRRLDESDWPTEMRVQHETIESIYTHDPNGYMLEITRALRPVTPQEDQDAAISVQALLDIADAGTLTLDALLQRKAELILAHAEEWEQLTIPEEVR